MGFLFLLAFFYGYSGQHFVEGGWGEAILKDASPLPFKIVGLVVLLVVESVSFFGDVMSESKVLVV